MNYLQPRELKDKDGQPIGLYHYTSMNDGTIHPIGYCSPPIGYCSPFELCPECKGGAMFLSGEECQRCDSKGVVEMANPCPGHATPEEARQHYTQYLLDKKTRYQEERSGVWHECLVCGALTNKFAQVGSWHTYSLCDEHRNREHVEKLLGIVGDSAES